MAATNAAPDRANTTVSALPPGQKEISEFPRFGLNQYADRYRLEFDPLQLEILGEVDTGLVLDTESLASLPRIDQVSDFHCVTTWSKRGLKWSGYLFRDFYAMLQDSCKPAPEAKYVVAKAQDGFRCQMLLEDLLAGDVLLADRLNDEPLCSRHGAPLRLVAPAHYGYKSVKHVKSIGFYSTPDHFKIATNLALMDNLRARVALEERGTGIPGWLLRYVYRPVVGGTIKKFKKIEQRVEAAAAK